MSIALSDRFSIYPRFKRVICSRKYDRKNLNRVVKGQKKIYKAIQRIETSRISIEKNRSRFSTTQKTCRSISLTRLYISDYSRTRDWNVDTHLIFLNQIARTLITSLLCRITRIRDSHDVIVRAKKWSYVFYSFLAPCVVYFRIITIIF